MVVYFGVTGSRVSNLRSCNETMRECLEPPRTHSLKVDVMVNSR